MPGCLAEQSLQAVTTASGDRTTRRPTDTRCLPVLHSQSAMPGASLDGAPTRQHTQTGPRQALARAPGPGRKQVKRPGRGRLHVQRRYRR